MEARTATARWTAAAGEATFGAGHVGGLQAMVGGTQEEVPLKTFEGGEKMGGHSRAREVRWGPGSGWLGTLRELLAGRPRGASADGPGAPTPREAEGNTGWDGRPAGWAGNLGCLRVFLDLRPICLRPNDNLALFSSVQCSEWPIPGTPAEGPSEPLVG